MNKTVDKALTNHVAHAIITVNGHPAQPGIAPGCSAPNGHYVSAYAILTAAEFGWDDLDASAAADAYLNSGDCNDPDTWFDMVTNAETWLNEVTIGGAWVFAGGDFCLIRTLECERCGGIYPDAETCPYPSGCEDGHESAWMFD